MSDTVKLIIEIPKDIYERCKEYKLWSYDAETLEGAVATSKPLSENKGEWIPVYGKNGKTIMSYKCSECDFHPKHAIITDFCGGCGADMRGEK